MPGLLKIGYSKKDPNLRAEELANTGSPHRYEVEYDALVNDPYSIEQKIHRVFASKNEGKEWFRCGVEDAVSEIRRMLEKHIILEKIYKQPSFKCSIVGCNEKVEIKDDKDSQYYCSKHHAELLEQRALIDIANLRIGKERVNRNHFKKDNPYDRILVVDDEEVVVELIEEVIKDEYPNLHIEKAYDGEDALNKIRSNFPDLLITNIVMPRMDGLQLLEILHNEDKDIPTIIISGYLILNVLKIIKDMQLSRQTEIIAIKKPFKSGDLIQAFNEITGRSNIREQK